MPSGFDYSRSFSTRKCADKDQCCEAPVLVAHGGVRLSLSRRLLRASTGPTSTGVMVKPCPQPHGESHAYRPCNRKDDNAQKYCDSKR